MSSAVHPVNGLSVVIPVFNEKDTIEHCLAHLSSQLDDIGEIVVVNNNSTDQTAAIVRSIQEEHPTKIRIIDEPSPGLIPARNAGVAAARFDVIARIDADTRVHAGWARAIVDYFRSAESSVGAATGPVTPFDSAPVYRNQFVKAQDRQIAKGMARSQDPRGFAGVAAVRGPNMAFRRHCWEAVREALSTRSDIYEDLDFSLCLRKAGFAIACIPAMAADISGRRFVTAPSSFWKYTATHRTTYLAHGDEVAARKSLRTIWIDRLVYLVFLIPNRAFDHRTGRSSLPNVFARRKRLPIPTSVDR